MPMGIRNNFTVKIQTILTAVKIIRNARPRDDGDDYELVDD